MSLIITPEDFNGNSNYNCEYNKKPDICPLCHQHINPKVKMASLSEFTFGKKRLQILFRCVNSKCDRLFIGEYSQKSMDNRPTAAPNYSTMFYFDQLMPVRFQEQEFSDNIKNLSPSFKEIYNQAIAAEISELNHIAGMGFRKALEFLIKDFAISQNPNEEEKIKKSLLGNVIKNYIDDPRLKSTAERAVWLGNDETHYVRKWVDKDVNDLKLLIKISLNWVENVLLTEEYSSNMSV